MAVTLFMITRMAARRFEPPAYREVLYTMRRAILKYKITIDESVEDL